MKTTAVATTEEKATGKKQRVNSKNESKPFDHIASKEEYEMIQKAGGATRKLIIKPRLRISLVNEG